MKEKVKDLDPVLRNVIDSQISRYPKMDEMDAGYYFQFVDWSKCSNEERLKYAELMYGDGVVFNNPLPEYSFDIGRSSGKFIITDYGIADASENGSCVYDNRSGIWAKILFRPDEKEETKPLFKVGDRPQWTEDLIKQLPNGARLECPFFKENFEFRGEHIAKDRFGDLQILCKNDGPDYFFKRKGVHAKIVSLPEETKEPEFQPGEMVYVKMDAWEDFDREPETYIKSLGWGNDIIHVTIIRGTWRFRDHIRKIQPDPEKKYRDIAEKIKSTGSYRYQMIGSRKWVLEEDVDIWLIEALKTEVK